jgi:hypothetical protein
LIDFNDNSNESKLSKSRVDNAIDLQRNGTSLGQDTKTLIIIIIIIIMATTNDSPPSHPSPFAIPVPMTKYSSFHVSVAELH